MCPLRKGLAEAKRQLERPYEEVPVQKEASGRLAEVSEGREKGLPSIMRPSYKFVVLGALALSMSCSAIPPSGSAPEVHIPRGMHAVSMHIDENVSVASGDHVDVLLTTKQGQTSTALENVEVVAVNQSTRVVTFLASPDDAQKVMAAEGEFRLRLW